MEYFVWVIILLSYWYGVSHFIFRLKVLVLFWRGLPRTLWLIPASSASIVISGNKMFWNVSAWLMSVVLGRIAVPDYSDADAFWCCFVPNYFSTTYSSFIGDYCSGFFVAESFLALSFKDMEACLLLSVVEDGIGAALSMEIVLGIPFSSRVIPCDDTPMTR